MRYWITTTILGGIAKLSSFAGLMNKHRLSFLLERLLGRALQSELRKVITLGMKGDVIGNS